MSMDINKFYEGLDNHLHKLGIIFVVEDVKEPLPVFYNDVAIVIEEKIVMRHLDDVPNAFVNLMGLLYMLNLDYLKDLKYTFEVIQRLFMGIEKTHT